MNPLADLRDLVWDTNESTEMVFESVDELNDITVREWSVSASKLIPRSSISLLK